MYCWGSGHKAVRWRCGGNGGGTEDGLLLGGEDMDIRVPESEWLGWVVAVVLKTNRISRRMGQPTSIRGQ